MCKKTTALAFIGVLFIIFSLNKTAYSLSPDLQSQKILPESLQSLQETISALDITRKKYQNKLLTHNSPHSISYKKESVLKKEYSIFVDYLSFQINNYCSELVKDYGEEAINKLPCYSNNIEAINNYETSEEEIESLDNEFMTALGEFDEMLLNEDEKIAQISQKKLTEKNNNGQSGNMSGEDTAEGAANGRSNKSKETNEQSENNNKQTDKQSSNSKGSSKQSSRDNYKRKKLDTIDDDIVSRQLKEAAEKETNPELKEKLWDEYYKYKQTIGK